MKPQRRSAAAAAAAGTGDGRRRRQQVAGVGAGADADEACLLSQIDIDQQRRHWCGKGADTAHRDAISGGSQAVGCVLELRR